MNKLNSLRLLIAEAAQVEQAAGLPAVTAHTATAETPERLARWTQMHKREPYKCSICGAEVPDLPMPVLQHQMSHARRRPYAKAVPEPAAAARKSESTESQQVTQSSRDFHTVFCRIGICGGRHDAN